MSRFTVADVDAALGLRPASGSFTVADVDAALGLAPSAPAPTGPARSTLTGEPLGLLPPEPFAPGELDALNMAAAVEQRAAAYTPEQIAQGREMIRARGGRVADRYSTSLLGGVLEYSHPAWDDQQVARWMAEQEISVGQGVMRPGQGVTGPEAFWTEAGRYVGLLLPSEGGDAISRLGATLQQAPPTQGGYSTAGKVAGSAGLSLGALAGGPVTMAGLPIGFGVSAIRDAPELAGAEVQGETWGDAMGRAAGALGRGVAEGGSEYLGTIFDLKILRALGQTLSAQGRDAGVGMALQLLRAAARTTGAELGEEEFALAAQTTIDVVEGRMTPDEAVRSFAAAQPELLTVTGLSGLATGGVGGLVTRATTVPQAGPDYTGPFRDAIGREAAAVRAMGERVEGARAARQRSEDLLAQQTAPGMQQAAQARSDALLERQTAPARQRSEDLLARQTAGYRPPMVEQPWRQAPPPSPGPAQQIGEGLPPQPDQVLPDGTLVYNDREAAERLIAFRNARLTEGDLPLRAVEIMPGAAQSPWAVVPDTRMEEARARGERQSAEVTEFARAGARQSRPGAGTDIVPGEPRSVPASSADGPASQQAAAARTSPAQAAVAPPPSGGIAPSPGVSPDRPSSASAAPVGIAPQGPGPGTSPAPAATPTTAVSPSASQPPSRNFTPAASLGRINERADAIESEGHIPYVTFSRNLGGGKSRYEAISRDGQLLAVGTREAGPGSIGDKFARRKGRYSSAVGGAFFRLPEGREATWQTWAELEAELHAEIEAEKLRVTTPDRTVEAPVPPVAPKTPAERKAERQERNRPKTPEERKAGRQARKAGEEGAKSVKESPSSAPRTPLEPGTKIRVSRGSITPLVEILNDWTTSDAAIHGYKVREVASGREYDVHDNQILYETPAPEPTVAPLQRDEGGKAPPPPPSTDEGVKVGDRIPWRNSPNPNEAVREIEIVALTPTTATVRWVGGEELQRLPREAIEQRLAERPEAPITPAPDAGLKVGDRVTWESGGKTLTGTITSDWGDEWKVDADQRASVGGVPIGRIEIVPKGGLRPIEATPTPAPDVSSRETADATVDQDQPGPERQEPGVGRGLPGDTREPERPARAPRADDAREGSDRGAQLPPTPGDQVQDGGRGEPRAEGPGGRGGRGSARKRGAGADRGPDAAEQAGPRGEGEAAPALRPERPKDLADRNHRIAPDDLIAPKSDTAKIKGNIAAVRLLLKLEKAGRNPTPEEKQVLARYVGWGSTGVAPVTDTLRPKRLLDHAERMRRYEEQKAEYERKGLTYMLQYHRSPLDDEEYAEAVAEAQKWEEKYGEFQKELLELVGESGLRNMQASTPFAHYTSSDVIRRGIWAAVERLGFKGGNVLETSAGVGHMIGLQPENLADISKWTAVEIESIPARIMAKLYPEAHVINEDFGKAQVAPASIDLIVGNVPFAASKMTWENQPVFSLHNAFMARSLRMLRPDGLMVVITSRSTLDERSSDEFRAWATQHANFVGAIRLPEVAFMENAGTKVTTDILVFQKKGKHATGQEWVSREKISVPNRRDKKRSEIEIDLNEYFHKRPDMMLGRLVADGLYPDSSDLDSTIEVDKGDDWLAKLDGAVQQLPANIAQEGSYERVVADGGEGAIDLDEAGNPYRVVNGRQEPIGGKAAPFFKRWVPLKKEALALFDMQVDPEATDAAIEKQRDIVRKQYQELVAKHGRMGEWFDEFESDADAYRVASLERTERSLVKKTVRGKERFVFEESFVDADILTTRTQYPAIEPTSADSVEDAATISEVWKGRLDLDYMASLLKTSTQDVRLDLLGAGIVFVDPVSGELIPRDDYLSGHIRSKIEQAREAAKADPSFAKNVEELEKVLPARQPITKVHITLGASWIPPEAMEDFAADRLDGEKAVRVVYSETVRAHQAVGASRPTGIDVARGAGAIEGSQPNMPLSEIIAKTINFERIVILESYTRDDGSTGKRQHKEATAAAQYKQRELQDQFARWAKGSEKWALKLEDAFNEKMNSSVHRQWSPPNIKHLPGSDPRVTLRPHQLRDIYRALRHSHLNAHEVGTGKTYIIISTAMEMRRLGLARKPMIVVQNSTIGGFARSFAALYPSARILVPSSKDFKPKSRKRTMQSIASNDWDAVIIPQSQIEKIANDAAREQDFVYQLQSELEDAIVAEGGNPAKASFSRDPKIKALARRLTAVNKLIKKLLEGKRDEEVFPFEKLGVDALLVDEAHAYKKLAFVTVLPDVKGMDTSFSKRGLNMVLKTKYVQDRRGGKNVHFYTGTPITNTIAEAWTMMRYLRPDILDDNGITTFDQFVAAYASRTTEYEMQGGIMLKPVERLRAFNNVPVLQRLWMQIVDEQTAEDAGIPRPPIRGGGRQVREIQPTQRLYRYMRRLLEQYKAFEAMTPKQRFENRHIPGQLNAQARAAAVDMRLVNETWPDDKASKLNAIAAEMYRIWKETEGFNGVQVGFLDRFRRVVDEPTGKFKTDPDTGEDIPVTREVEKFNAFHALRDKLVSMGVPAEQIAVMTDNQFSDLEKREPVFEAARQGIVRFVFASTQRAGIGVNIQTRLVALHHMDAPFTAADMDQREGRIHRQGNETVELSGTGYLPQILGWGVLKSFDSGQYERLARKATIQRQFRSGHAVGETIEDDDDILSYAQAAANLTGNPLFKEKATLEGKIRDLTGAFEDHQQGQIYLKRQMEDAERSAEQYRRDAEQRKHLVEKHLRPFKQSPEVRIGGRTARTEEEIAELVKDTLEEGETRINALLDGEGTKGSSFRRKIAAVTANGLEFELQTDAGITRDGARYIEFQLTHPTLLPWHFRKPVKSHIGIINALNQGMSVEEAEAEIGRHERWSKEKLAEAEKLRGQLGQKFEGVEEIDVMKRRVAEINTELAKDANTAEGLEDDDVLTQEQLGEAIPDAPARGPTSAPDTGPERQRRPIDRLLGALDQMESSARARMQRRQIPHGRNVGATTLPEDIADMLIVGAASFLKGGVRFAQWSREMTAEFGERIKGRIREVWKDSRELAQDIIDGLESPQPTIERVRERIDAAGDRGPTRGSVPETRAVHVAYQAGLRAVRDQIPAIRAKVRQAEQDKGKARLETLRGIQQEIRRLVEDNLPPAFRGRFLADLTGARGFASIHRSINRIRRELARAQGIAAYRRVQLLRRRYLRILSPNAEAGPSPRQQAAAHIREANSAIDLLKRTGRGVVPTETMERAADRLIEAFRGLATLVAEARAERETFLAAQLGTVQEHVAAAVEAIEKQPRLRDREGSAEDVKTPTWKRPMLQLDDWRLITTQMDGGKGTLWAVGFRNMRTAHEAYLSNLRDYATRLDALVRAAGYRSTADAVSRLSGRRGEGVTERVRVTLGGKEVSIAKGELMGLYAMDPATLARIAPQMHTYVRDVTKDGEVVHEAGDVEITPGAPIQFQRGRHRQPLAVTLEEIERAVEKLSDEDRALVDGIKDLFEEFRPALFEAHYRLKGYYPEEVIDYWPSKRNLRYSPSRGLPEGWASIRERYIENAGFLQERTGGTLPFVVGDVVSVAMEHIDASMKVIHLAEATRTAASVLLAPDVQTAINERFGASYNRAVEDFLRAISLAQEADATGMGEAVRWLNQSLATSTLGMNPGTWARQLGGIPRLRAVMPAEAFDHGFAHWHEHSMEELVEGSGHFWQRYVGNIAGRFSPVGGESYADVARPEFLTAMDNAQKEIRAFMRTGRMGDLWQAFQAARHGAATALGILNAFDAVNAKIAFAGWLYEAKRRYPKWSDAERAAWAMSRAWDTISQTQNPSSVLDYPLFGVRVQGKGTAAWFLFTSDTVKARNRIVAGFRESKTEGAKQVVAEAANIVWSRAVGWGITAGVAAAVTGLAGGDWDEWRERFLRLDRVLFDTARDVLALIAPVGLPDVLEAFRFGSDGLLRPPAQEAIVQLADSLMRAGSIGAKLPEGRKVDDFTIALLRAANELSSVGGVNPLASMVGRALREADRLDEQEIPNEAERLVHERTALRKKQERGTLSPEERSRLGRVNAFYRGYLRLSGPIRKLDAPGTTEAQRARADRLRQQLRELAGRYAE